MAEMGAFRRQPSGGALSHLFNPASSLGGNASLANALDDLPFDLFLSGCVTWDAHTAQHSTAQRAHTAQREHSRPRSE